MPGSMSAWPTERFRGPVQPLGAGSVNSYLQSMAVKTSKLMIAANADVLTKHGARSDSHEQAKALEPQRKRLRVKVGGIFVMGDKASSAQLRQSVAKSAEMLERLGRTITRPGVQLKAARNIPLFSADPKDPGRFLRKLNGKIERGVLEDGAFKVLD